MNFWIFNSFNETFQVLPYFINHELSREALHTAFIIYLIGFSTWGVGYVNIIGSFGLTDLTYNMTKLEIHSPDIKIHSPVFNK